MAKSIQVGAAAAKQEVEKKEEETKQEETQQKTESETAPETVEPAETVQGFLSANEVQLGESYLLFNATKHRLRCPYSRETFPPNNFSLEKVVVNNWVLSQIAAGLLKAKA